jgi:hypothetical protein
MTQNPQLRAALTRAIQRLLAVRPNARAKITEALLDEWVAALNGVALAAIDEAVARCNASEEYFPSPATFRRYVREVAAEQARERGEQMPRQGTQEPACLTCGTPTCDWVEAVPIGSQTGNVRLFCRCAITTGHAVYPGEWDAARRRSLEEAA